MTGFATRRAAPRPIARPRPAPERLPRIGAAPRPVARAFAPLPASVREPMAAGGAAR